MKFSIIYFEYDYFYSSPLPSNFKTLIKRFLSLLQKFDSFQFHVILYSTPFLYSIPFLSFLSFFIRYLSILSQHFNYVLFYPILRFYMFYPFYADFTIQFFILFTFPFFLISPVFPANIFFFNIFTF